MKFEKKSHYYSDPVNMKSQGDENTDDDCLDDPIRLHFGDNTPRLEKIQFLDPGIIDLDCDSDEDCPFVNENPDDFNTPRITATHHLPPVTSPISKTVCIKPMSIKIVDCYKFPWFFDQLTREIIEKKLFINKNVNNNTMSNEEMNVNNEEFKNVSDTYCVKDGNYTGMFIFEAVNNKNVNNNLSRQIVDGSSNKQININNTCTYETIDYNNGLCFDKGGHNYTDMKSVHKTFGTKMRVVNRKKQLENYNKRNDIEKQRAINQRNKTTVDIKKNTGLVGMKIQRITSEKQTMNMKKTMKKIVQTSKEKKKQKTLDKLYVKAVDKVLINIGTTITPVFDEIKGCANESGQCVYQNIHEDSIVKPINRNGGKKNTLEIEKNGKEQNQVSRQKDKLENENMMEFINSSKMIAEEIVRLTTPFGKRIGQVKEKHKSKGDTIKICNEINTAKKTENQNTKEHTGCNHSSLKKPKLFDDSKITKTIAPMPLSLKIRNKERFKSARSSKTMETCEKKEYEPPIPASYPHKKKTDIKNKHDQINCRQETDKIISAKHTPSSQRSGCHVKNKWFPTLNRYTKHILNKIKAKQHKQYKINQTNISHKQHAKKPSNFVQSKSEECQSMPSIANITKDVPLDDKICKKFGSCMNSCVDHSIKNNSVTKINDVKNAMSPIISKTQLQYSDKNQLEDLTNTKTCHTNNHLHVQLHIKQPLNTSFVKAAKTDYETNNKVPVSEENTQPIKTDNKISSNQHTNITEHPLIEKQAGLKRKIQVTKIDTDIRNLENIVKHEENLNVSTEQTNTSIITDKCSIHTIVTNQNEADPTKHINTQKVDLTDHNFLPNTPCSAIIKGMTQTQNHQAKVTNKPSTIYNSMQAHILYRPLDGNSQPPSQMFSNNSGFQVPKQHIGQPIYPQLDNHQQYLPSYTEEILPNNIMSMNARLHSEVNEGIPPQINMNIRPFLESDRGISPQMAFNTRPHAAANGLSPSQSTTINVRSSGVNEGITPQVESNARLMSPRVKCGISPLMTFNIPPPGVIARMSSQMGMNDSTAGVNGDIPPQMARNDRPMPSSVSDMMPSNIVWSYAFPPPDPPPPPPPLPPYSQETPVFPIESQDDSSIIGKNNDGIIKKINITAPVIDQNTETYSEKGHIVENIHSVSTPLYDEIATVDSYENSVSKIIKSEIIQESDDIHQMKSPVKYSTSTHPMSTTGILCNLPAESYACPTMSRSSLQSNSEPSNIVKKEKAQHRITDKKNKTTIPITTTDTYVTNSKKCSDKCPKSDVRNLRNPFDFYEGSKHCKELTSVDKPSINRLTNSKAKQIKPNESSTTSSTRIEPQPIAKLTVNNPRYVGKTKSTTSKDVTHSKIPPHKYKKIIKPTGFTKKLLTHLFEDSTSFAINYKKTDSDPVNLKRTQPSIDDTKNSPPAKYKPGPLSKKMQFHNQKQKEKDSPGKTEREQVLPSKGYSAPILPIPTYESLISDLPDSCNKLLDRPVEKSNKPFDQAYARMKKTCSLSIDEPPRNQSSKVDRTKKISLEEYKKKRLANERKNQEGMAYFDNKKDISFKNNTVDMPRRASNVESDLGYDSDSTVILQTPL